MDLPSVFELDKSQGHFVSLLFSRKRTSACSQMGGVVGWNNG